MSGDMLDRFTESAVEVSAAVKAAKEWIIATMSGEGITNIGLEEVEFDDANGLWLITIGFSRPWNSVRNAMTAITGEPAASRIFRVISVKDADGRVVSMKKRDTVDA